MGTSGTFPKTLPTNHQRHRMDLMLLHGAMPSCPHPSFSELIRFLKITPLPYTIKIKGNIAERIQLTGIVNLPAHQTLLSPIFVPLQGIP